MLDCIFALSGSIFLSAAWMQAPKSWLSNLKITVNWKAELICSTMGLRSKMILTRQNTHPWNEISRHIRIQNTNKEMHTSLRETKLGETRCGRVPRRGDRLEAFIDFWLNISQHLIQLEKKKLPGCTSRSEYLSREKYSFMGATFMNSIQLFLSKKTDS